MINKYDIPKLPTEKKINTPHGYFEDLEKKIMTKITTKQSDKANKKVKFLSFKPMAMAASVALLIWAGMYFFTNNKPTNNISDSADWELLMSNDTESEDYEANYEEGLEEEFAYE